MIKTTLTYLPVNQRDLHAAIAMKADSTTPVTDAIRQIYLRPNNNKKKKCATKRQRVARSLEEIVQLTKGNPNSICLNEFEVAILTNLSVHTLRAYRCRPAPPIAFAKHGRRVLYLLSDVLNFLSNLNKL